MRLLISLMMLLVLAGFAAIVPARPTAARGPRIAALPIISMFQANDEGWRILKSFDNQAVNVPRHRPGSISSDNKNFDRSVSSFPMWSAPAKFKGDLTEAFLGELTFKLKAKPVDKPLRPRNSTIDILGDVWMSAEVKAPKPNEWTRYRVPLHAAGKWRTGLSHLNEPANNKYIRRALTNVQTFRIRGAWTKKAQGKFFLSEVAVTSPDGVPRIDFDGDPTTVDLGAAPVGAQTEPVVFTILNTGSAMLTVKSQRLRPPFFSKPVMGKNIQILPQGQFKVTLSCKPQRTGVVEQPWRLETDDPARLVVDVTLTARGVGR